MAHDIFLHVLIFCIRLQDLITRVRQLESHVNQLRNVVMKSQNDPAAKLARKKQREFDFKRYLICKSSINNFLLKRFGPSSLTNCISY